jgi:hypothetical protein
MGAIQAWAVQNQVATNWFEAIGERWELDQNTRASIAPPRVN